MTPIIFLKARDRHDSGTGDMFAPLPGTHVETHTRKDGVVQTYHVSAPAQHAPAVHVVFVHHKPVDTSSNMSNNGPVNNTGGIMEMTMTRAAAAETKYGTARLDRCLSTLAEYTAADSVIKSRMAELRSDMSGCYRDAADATVSRAYLAMNPRPEGWASDVYFDIKSPVSMKKCLRAAMPHAGKSALADMTIAFIAEWQPVFAQLDALKSKITTVTAIRSEKKEAEARAVARIPRTKLSIVVHDAVMAHKPVLVEDYKQWITGLHERMIRDLGKDRAQWKKSPHYKGWMKTYDNTLYHVMTGADLNYSTLSAKAIEYADAIAEGMAAKITSKAGDLQNPTIKHLDGHHFVVHGTMHGKPVAIWQNVIVNVSRLGTVFNQWPARIRYDGKAVSEAEFKTLQLAGPDKPVVFPKP